MSTKSACGIGGIDGRVGAGDADAVVGEDFGDLGDDAGAVGDVEADVIGRGGLADGEDAAVFAVREEAAVAGGQAE